MHSDPRVSRQNLFFVNRYFYPDQSATSQMLSDLSFGLAKRGWPVHVICSRQKYGQPDAKLPARETINDVVVHRIWTTRFGRDHLVGRAVDYATFYLSSALHLIRVLRRGDMVIAKTDPPLISIVAMVAARLKSAILINWLQDIFPEIATELGANPLPHWLDKSLRRWRDRSLRAARANVVLGARMRELLARRGIDDRAIRIIENWADGDTSEPLAGTESRLRGILGLVHQFVVGYSGNLGRAHEYQTILGAALSLSHFEDVVFLMIGAGAGMIQLQRTVGDRGLKNFRFLPYQPRAALSDSMAAADVHWVSLLPTLEGLIVPSKFYGILAAGRPVIFIGDREGELAEVIHRSEVGGAVSVGDSAELVRLVLLLRSDARARHAMGSKARQLYREKYTAGRALEQWAELLHEPIGDHPRGPASKAVL